MCAASNTNIDLATENQKWTQRAANAARPAVKYVTEILMAPVELVQRIFYRPNSRQDKIVVEDLNAKFKQSLNETYITVCSQKLRNKPAAVKLDPRKTYDNLQACQSGTFKTIATATQPEEQVPQLQLIDEIEELQCNNVVYLPSPSLSDSQILRARPAMTDSQILRARPAMTDSQILKARPSMTDSQALRCRPSLASNVKCGFTQSGVYQLIEPDINPHGLQQFIETHEERSA